MWFKRDCVSSTCLRVELISLICLTFVITLTPAAPPSYEPVIYLHITRWENRTVSPRRYYIWLTNEQKSVKKNQIDQDGYQITVELPPAINKIETAPFISLRHGFGKPGNAADPKGVSPPSGSSKAGEVLTQVTPGSSDEVFSQYEDAESAITFGGGSNVKKENTPIVFEPGAVDTISNRKHEEESTERHSKEPDLNNVRFRIEGNGFDIARFNRICGENSKRGRGYESGTLEGGLNTMEFTFQVVHKTKEHTGNFVFSPFSVINILTLLFLGSTGASHQELAKVLGVADKSVRNETYRNKDAKFHKGVSDATYALLQCSSSIVESANKMFTHAGYNISPDFKSFAKSYYDADIESYDFLQGTDFADIANDWIKRNTKGQIQSIIDHAPSPYTTLVMLNALYFKGEWDSPFEPRLTRSGQFFTKDNTSVSVQMMTNVMTIPHIQAECYQMIRLSYDGNDTSMFIILPAETGIDYLQRVERELTAKDVQDNINHLSGVYPPPKLVTVKMPKMRVENLGHLRTVLEDIGLKTVFSRRNANFSNISPEPGMYVDSVLHKAVVEIDEKGSVASAVSVATVDRIIDRNPIIFNANRPFIFFIYNHVANLTLFWGRVTDPVALDRILDNEKSRSYVKLLQKGWER